MSENLSNFLVDLASDPNRMARFASNPVMTLDEAGLTADEKAAVMAQDPRRLAAAFGDDPDPIIEQLETVDVPTIRRAPGRKRPPSRKRAPRRPVRKAPSKRKAPAKRRAPARRRAPAKRKAPARRKTSRTTRKKK